MLKFSIGYLNTLYRDGSVFRWDKYLVLFMYLSLSLYNEIGFFMYKIKYLKGELIEMDTFVNWIHISC